MDYIEKYYSFEDNLSEDLNQFKFSRSHYNNKTANILKKLGYKYYHILNYWEEESVNGAEIADYRISIIPFITSRLIKFVFWGTPLANLIKNLAMKNERMAICKVFNELEKISKEKSSNPKFVMAHIICPHGPYYFDKNGDLPSKELNPDNYEDHKNLYLGQVEFINKKLENCFSKIIENNKNVIIVLQADHGSGLLLINNPNWENLSPEALEEKYSIQKAVYAPNLNIEAKSSVNTFRYIINSISNADLDILEDKCFYRNYTYSRFKGDSIKVDFFN